MVNVEITNDDDNAPKVGQVAMNPETFETVEVTRVNEEEGLVDIQFLEEGAVEVGMETITIEEFNEKFDVV